MYSPFCQPAGGEDLPCQGRSKAMTRKRAERLGVVEEAAVLPAVGAGRVQAHERNALAGLLDVEAVRLAGDVEVQVAADGRLEPGLAGLLIGRLPAGARARQRQQILEVAQVGHEGILVAVER